MFNLAGVAGTQDQVAETLERLSLLPMLTNVTLSSTSTVVATPAAGPNGSPAPAKAGPTHVQFSLTAGVLQVPTAAAQ